MASVKGTASFVGVGVSCIKSEHRKIIVIVFSNYFHEENNKVVTYKYGLSLSAGGDWS